MQKQCIHDNFLHVQNLVKELHRTSRHGLFLKLDISKAFDSVGWAYLLDAAAWIWLALAGLDLHDPRIIFF